MTASRFPCLGSVVWVELADARGALKVRPAVVISPTAQITTGATIRVVAVTSRLPDVLPQDHVLLPWHPQGKARSGLRRRCAAVVTWQAVVPVEKVQEVVGILPNDVIAELLAKVKAILNGPTDEDDTI